MRSNQLSYPAIALSCEKATAKVIEILFCAKCFGVFLPFLPKKWSHHAPTTAFRPHFNHIPTTFRPHFDHVPTAREACPMPRADARWCRSAIRRHRLPACRCRSVRSCRRTPADTLADTANITLRPSRVNIHLLEKVQPPTANFFAPATRSAIARYRPRIGFF